MGPRVSVDAQSLTPASKQTIARLSAHSPVSTPTALSRLSNYTLPEQKHAVTQNCRADLLAVCTDEQHRAFRSNLNTVTWPKARIRMNHFSFITCLLPSTVTPTEKEFKMQPASLTSKGLLSCSPTDILNRIQAAIHPKMHGHVYRTGNK